MQPLTYLCTAGALGVALLAVSATTTLAQEPQKEELELVKQCQQQALQGPNGQKLTGNPLDETNVSDYTPGEAYELHINFIGHGNTFYNVTCQVDEQGKVTFESVEESGQPQT